MKISDSRDLCDIEIWVEKKFIYLSLTEAQDFGMATIMAELDVESTIRVARGLLAYAEKKLKQEGN